MAFVPDVLNADRNVYGKARKERALGFHFGGFGQHGDI